ncbi:MAG: TatD family hydrolase, partial [Firmicutes bacterium]|nr:TatD family hydrolase [Bacillota bacterium]
EADLDELLALSKHPKCVAIGEIGLDYHYDDADPQLQQYWFLRQLEVVEQSGLPTIIHLRDADGDMQKIVKVNRARFKAPAVLHCFSGSVESAAFYLSQGFYISFAGVITYQNARRYADIVRSIPKGRLLIETDCPYLTPEPFRGRLNVPAHIKFVAAKAAEYLSVTEDEVAEITRENAYRLFTKMTRD